MRHSGCILIVLATFLVLTGLCCKDEPTKPYDTTFALTAEDVSCTETWLRLTIGANITPRTIELKRDTITLFTKTIDAAQTIVVDTNLIPNHTYLYQVNILRSAFAGSISNVLISVTTMDITSHAWTFTTSLLGDGTSSSVLFDVAIINDTLAYACGEINSGGTTYNVAKWDGSSWQLKQLYYNGSSLIVPIRGVFAFGSDDVWLAAGSVFPLGWSLFTSPTNIFSLDIWWNNRKNMGSYGFFIIWSWKFWNNCLLQWPKLAEAREWNDVGC